MKKFYHATPEMSKSLKPFMGMVVLMIFSFLAPVNSSYGQNVLDRAGLDGSVTVEAAYSLRQLSTSYLGFAIKVRKTTTLGDTTNIGFTATGDLDTAALKIFAGAAGTIYVTKWYDQSGQGRDVVQTTTGNQPIIVNAGAIYYNNGRPAIWFPGSAKNLSNSFGTDSISYPVSLSIVANTEDASTNGGFVKLGLNSGGGDGLAVGIGNTTLENGGKNLIVLRENGKVTSGWAVSTPNVGYGSNPFTIITTQGTTGNTTRTYLNGKSITLSVPTGTPLGTGIRGGIQVGGYNNNRHPKVKESEVIYFSNLITTEIRNALECNQQSYYSIKVVPDEAVTVCSGEAYITVPANTTYTWSLPMLSSPGITGASTGASLASFSQTLYNGTGDIGTATYTVTPTCYGVPFKVTITVRPFSMPGITITEDYCTIGDGKVKLTSSPRTLASYLWSNGSTDDSIIIDKSGLYSLNVTDINGCSNRTSVNIGNELVINGDFSQGKDVGYTTGYPWNTRLGSTANYCINTDAHNAHSNFWGKDHTTGTGNFMIVNGEDSLKIWETKVKVDSGARYYFSAWAMSLNANGPFAQLVFNVDGQNVGSVAVLDTGVQNNSNYGWTKFYGQWDAGFRDASNDSVVIRMVNLQGGDPGNDFGLDDISFSTLPPISFFGLTLGNGGNSVCIGQDLQLTSKLEGGKAPFTYLWKDPLGNTLPNVPNPFLNSPIEEGVYTLKATDSAGCPANATINIIAGNPNVTSIKNVNQCNQNLRMEAYGLIPNTINLKLYYTVAALGAFSKVVDSVIVNANAAGTATFSLKAPPTPLNNNFYKNRIVTIDSVSNGSCKAYPGVSWTLGDVFANISWRGGNTGDWNVDENWCPKVPIYGNDVTIPLNNTITIKENQVAVCSALTLQAGARLILEEGAVLWIYGTLTVDATAKIDATKGTVQLLKDANYTLKANSFLDATIRNLIFNPYKIYPITDNRKFTISSSDGFLRISNLLEIAESTADLETSGKLILASSRLGTARLGQLAPGNLVTGDAVVERYLSAGRKWRLLAVPSTTTQTFRQAWQEGSLVANDNLKPGYGFKIGHPNNATYAALGFDMYAPGGPSVKSYNSSTNAWEGIASTNDAMATQAGYLSFVVGNRNTPVAVPNADTTTLRTIGGLKQQTQTVSIPQGKYAVVGNPYASPISLGRINLTNVQNTFIVWDPKLATPPYGLGAYQYLTYDEDLKSYLAVPGGGSYPEFDGITPVTSIESGLAFFVKAENTGTGTISFTEATKSSGDDFSVFAKQPILSGQKIIARLYAVPAADEHIVDGVMARFADAYHNEVNDEDVLKVSNSNENLSIITNNKSLVIDNRNSVSTNDTIQLKLSGVRIQNYRWKLQLNNMEATGLEAFLLDQYLQTNTPLQLSGETVVNFNIENIPGSYASDRFKIVFKQQAVLPVTITSIAANRNNDKTITIQWKVENEVNMQGYEVERSMNGRDFISLQTKAPQNNAGAAVQYNTIDADNLSGDLFYRIKANSLSRQVQYSAIVKVSGIKTNTSISVYPNPVIGKQMQVHFNSVETGNYQLSLMNTAGQVIYKAAVNVAAGSSAKTLQLAKDVAAGRYDLLITTPAGQQNYQQVIIQ